MSGVDLRQIGPGFSDLALGSQAVFRTTLQALSHPGQILTMSQEAAPPHGAHAAAALALLALLDQDCSLWLSPALVGSAAAAWLRFHTGCRIAERAADAQFAWIANANELPALKAFAQGSEFEPEKSTTCVVQVDALENGVGWTLHGPGINGVRKLAVPGLGEDFIAQWQDNHGRFPCGVDLLFSAGELLVGMPRTTRIGS
jgi:alpha-D-ribose 1-methylphosphonate 5-triphosphate synthase subunit PhnH